MVNELKAVSSVTVIVEGMCANGVQAAFKFNVTPQTQEKDQLEKVQKALPTLLEILDLKWHVPAATATVPTSIAEAPSDD